jgi:archaellum component FlaD/FlaE
MQLSPQEYDLMELRQVARPAEDGTEPPREDRPGGDRGAHRADGGAAVAGGPDPWGETGPRQPDATPPGASNQSSERGDRSAASEEQYTGGVPDHLRASDGRTRETAAHRPETAGREPPARGQAPRNERPGLASLALAGTGSQERPYLRSLPEGAATELLIFRWLEGLVERAGSQGAHDALEYYRAIDWLTEDAAANLQDYLGGLPDPAGDQPGLTTEDHRTSLEFVMHIAGHHGD